MISNNQEIELEKVKNEKDLGIIIDQNLTFRDHINSKVNIANRNLGIIFRTFTSLRERLRTHKVFTKYQCFYFNYHKLSIKSYVLDVY